MSALATGYLVTVGVMLALFAVTVGVNPWGTRSSLYDSWPELWDRTDERWHDVIFVGIVVFTSLVWPLSVVLAILRVRRDDPK